MVGFRICTQHYSTVISGARREDGNSVRGGSSILLVASNSTGVSARREKETGKYGFEQRLGIIWG